MDISKLSGTNKLILANLYQEFEMSIAPAITAVYGSLPLHSMITGNYEGDYYQYSDEAVKQAWGEFIQARVNFDMVHAEFNQLTHAHASAAWGELNP